MYVYACKPVESKLLLPGKAVSHVIRSVPLHQRNEQTAIRKGTKHLARGGIHLAIFKLVLDVHVLMTVYEEED